MTYPLTLAHVMSNCLPIIIDILYRTCYMQNLKLYIFLPLFMLMEARTYETL